jgi:acetyl esterase/lipase
MDVKAAIEYLYSKKDFYGFSDKFVLLGASAGAHLALLHAYKYQSPVKIKAVVDFFGPTDMTDLYNNPASLYAPSSSIAAVVGATPSSNPVIYTQSSPVTFVSASAAMPTIIFQGGMDPLVRPAQSATLHNLLVAAGIVNQYILYPNGGHGDWDQLTFTDAFNKTQAFLQANVQ